MIGIPCGSNLTNSPIGNAFWSWMLLSNNSHPYGRPENLANIVDLLYFLACPPMDLIGNETLWLVPVY